MGAASRTTASQDRRRPLESELSVTGPILSPYDDTCGGDFIPDGSEIPAPCAETAPPDHRRVQPLQMTDFSCCLTVSAMGWRSSAGATPTRLKPVPLLAQA